MNKEDIQLLTADISARYPYFYSLRVQYNGKDYMPEGIGAGRISLFTSPIMSYTSFAPLIEEVKPYLRPMSDITDIERNELSSKGIYIDKDGDIMVEAYEGRNISLQFIISIYIEWLKKYHFDYNYLIEKGLALIAPKDMYSNKFEF